MAPTRAFYRGIVNPVNKLKKEMLKLNKDALKDDSLTTQEQLDAAEVKLAEGTQIQSEFMIQTLFDISGETLPMRKCLVILQNVAEKILHFAKWVRTKGQLPSGSF